MADFYTTDGSVRGSCGHKHRSIRTAFNCLAEDHAGCVGQGGYSDRRIVRVDGKELSDDEFYEVEQLSFEED